MKRSGLLSFVTAFFVTLIFLALVAMLFVADSNTRAISGNPDGDALLAFSPAGPGELEITVLGEQWILTLNYPIVNESIAAVRRFYDTVAPASLRAMTETAVRALPVLWEGYCSAARWLAGRFLPVT